MRKNCHWTPFVTHPTYIPTQYRYPITSKSKILRNKCWQTILDGGKTGHRSRGHSHWWTVPSVSHRAPCSAWGVRRGATCPAGRVRCWGLAHASPAAPRLPDIWQTRRAMISQGQCHEMNIFLKVLKNENKISILSAHYMRQQFFLFFCILIVN